MDDSKINKDISESETPEDTRTNREISNANLQPAQKGEPSRNPAGRPKKKDTYSDVLREILQGEEIKVTWTIAGKAKEVLMTCDRNFYYGLATAMILEGLKGNVKAATEIIDRVQGKAQQYVHFDNKEEVDEAFRRLASGLQYNDTCTPSDRPDPDTD